MTIRHVAGLGEHNVEVLRTIAGLSEQEIKDLAEAGIISDSPKSGQRVP
jgi:hypothetical protein